jgi:hypothetical protein
MSIAKKSLVTVAASIITVGFFSPSVAYVRKAGGDPIDYVQYSIATMLVGLLGV